MFVPGLLWTSQSRSIHDAPVVPIDPVDPWTTPPFIVTYPGRPVVDQNVETAEFPSHSKPVVVVRSGSVTVIDPLLSQASITRCELIDVPLNPVFHVIAAEKTSAAVLATKIVSPPAELSIAFWIVFHGVPLEPSPVESLPVL
jgi:hypothetical protein